MDDPARFPDADASDRKSRIWTFSIWALVFALLGYLYYSLATATGLGGYLMRLQVRIFGSASDELALMAGLLILGAGAYIIVSLVERLLSPVFGPGAGAAAKRVFGAFKAADDAPSTTYSWKRVLIVGLAPAAIGLTVAGALYLIDHLKQRQPAYELDLTDSQAVVPSGISFVAVKGVVRGHYASRYEEGRAGADYALHFYAPVTGPNWTPEDPVRFLLYVKDHDSGGRDDEEELPDAFRQSGLVVSTGTLVKELPGLVRDDFLAKGLQVGSTLIIEWRESPDAGTPASDWSVIALGFGAWFSFLVFFNTAKRVLGEYIDRKRSILIDRARRPPKA